MLADAAIPRLFIFGLGYVGLHTACTARALGWHVSGSCRSPEKADALRIMGFGDVHAFDLDDAYAGLDADGLHALCEATHVLATVPPVADLDRDPCARRALELSDQAALGGELVLAFRRVPLRARRRQHNHGLARRCSRRWTAPSRSASSH